MFGSGGGQAPQEVAFLLVPGFSMMALFSAVEPLRVANRLSGRALYSWRFLTADGAPAEASNGMTVMADAALGEVGFVPTLVVVSGFDQDKGAGKMTLAALRRLSRLGAVIGALDTGTFILAAAGLLEGHSVTMHWEAVPAFRDAFPRIEVTDELYEIDRNVFTCAGGTAALDFVLHMIAEAHGHGLATAVSEQFIYERIRDRRSHQRMQVANRLGLANPKLVRVIEAMERNIESPLDVAALVVIAGVSDRQLERLFRTHLNATPIGYYNRIRLERARELLRQTTLSVLDVALSTGFTSASCLARAYRAQFGLSPRRDRQGGATRTAVPVGHAMHRAARPAAAIDAAAPQFAVASAGIDPAG